jgi:hypothetical protein
LLDDIDDDEEAGTNLEDQMEDDYDASHTDVPTTKTGEYNLSLFCCLHLLSVKPVAEWGVDEVQAWMSEESRKVIFEHYLQVFKDNEVAGVNLLGLDDTKLKNMEVKVLSHRDAIMKQVDSLKSMYCVLLLPQHFAPFHKLRKSHSKAQAMR